MSLLNRIVCCSFSQECFEITHQIRWFLGDAFSQLLRANTWVKVRCHNYLDPASSLSHSLQRYTLFPPVDFLIIQQCFSIGPTGWTIPASASTGASSATALALEEARIAKVCWRISIQRIDVWCVLPCDYNFWWWPQDHPVYWNPRTNRFPRYGPV